MRTGNPALNTETFNRFDLAAADATTMTLRGTATKTMALLLLVVAAAGFSWNLFLHQSPALTPVMLTGAVGGLIVALVTTFKPAWAALTAPLYAVLEGLLLGGISAMFNAQYQGLPFQAVCLTFGTLFSLLLAYQTGWIRATENFKLGVIAATGGIFLVYMATAVLGLFGIAMPFMHSNGLVGIGISLFVVVVAALNLVLDFDIIENGVKRGAPKYMEWYGAFGLLVTLVWLYLEILRLLAKLRSNDNK